MGWPQNTREFVVGAGAKSGTNLLGETLAWDLPKTGILGAILLVITGNLTTAPSTPNAQGKSRLIRRVRLTANAGINLCDFSGGGYHWLIRDYCEHLIDPVPQSDARAVAASGAFDLSMHIPISINSRDPLGLVNLQNPDTQLRLEVEVAPTTDLANDYTVYTYTVAPYLQMFKMPLAKEDRPKFDFLQTFQEDANAVTSGVEFVYPWLRGNTYMSVVHGCTLNAALTNSYTTAALRVNQNDYLRPPLGPTFYAREFSKMRGRTVPGGTFGFDLVSLSGLGNYGSLRDLLNTAQLTDIQSVIVPSATTTLFSMKRQLVYLGEAK